MKTANKKSYLTTLTSIILFALALRFWGISSGLPFTYYSDEPKRVISAQHIFKTGDLNPHYFLKPSLTIYLYSLAHIPYYWIGKAMGTFKSPLDIWPPLMITRGVGIALSPDTFLIGRIISTIFGIATLVFIFLIGRKLTQNTAVGLLAALMMAICPTHVARSRLVAPETAMIFFMMLSFYEALKILQKGERRSYWLAGIACGLAASCKYNGVLSLVFLISAHTLREGLRGLKDRRLYIAITLGVIAFFATSPFTLLDYKNFIAALQFDTRHYLTGHVGEEGGALIWYLKYLWQTEGPVVLLALFMIFKGFRARLKQIIFLSVFPVFYFLCIAVLPVRNARTLLPLLPFLFLLGCIFLVNLFDRLLYQKPKRWKLRVFFLGIVTFVTFMAPFIKTFRETLQLTAVNSRATARLWVTQHLPAGSRVAVESYGPYVNLRLFDVHGCERLIDYSAEFYVRNGFDFLVFSQGAMGRFFREPKRYSKEIAKYEHLFNTFELVKVFNDGGYEIRIYHVEQKENSTRQSKAVRP